VATQRVDDTETAINQVQDDMRNAEKADLTTTKPETTFEEMLNAIGDSQSDLASFNDEEDGEDLDVEEGDPAGRKLGEDDKPGWVMGTISKRYTIAWRVFSRCRSSFTTRHNQAGETQPTTSVTGIRSMGRPTATFRQWFNLTLRMMQRHLRRRHLVSVRRLLIASPENFKFRK